MPKCGSYRANDWTLERDQKQWNTILKNSLRESYTLGSSLRPNATSGHGKTLCDFGGRGDARTAAHDPVGASCWFGDFWSLCDHLQGFLLHRPYPLACILGPCLRFEWEGVAAWDVRKARQINAISSEVNVDPQAIR